MPESSATQDDRRLKLASARSSVSSAASELLCSECDQYSDLLRSLVSQFDRINNDFTTLATQAQDSRSTLRLGVGSLDEEISVPADGNDVLEYAFIPPPTDLFLLV